MVDVEDHHLIQSKHKAINALLPYAVQQEQDGQPEMLDAFLCAAKASRMSKFGWHFIAPYANTLLSNTSPNAIIFISPYIPWDHLINAGYIVQQWAVAVSAVPYTEQVAQSVVITLLLIAYWPGLSQHIPTDVWSWLTKQPSLPPICLEHDRGSDPDVCEVVLGLRDIEIIKSYFLLIWSEWNTLHHGGFYTVCASIRKDFSKAGNGHHRTELIHHLDHILAQLGQGLEYLQQNNPDLSEDELQRMKDQYGMLKDILLETNVEAVARMSHPIIVFLCMLTNWICIGSHATFMCALPLLC